MKTILLELCIILFLSCNHTKSPQYIADTTSPLQKYSYLIFSDLKNGKLKNGTGFFVKSGTNTLFVTAEHIISGWNNYKERKDSVMPDNFFIRLYKTNGESFLYPIDAAAFKKQYKPARFYERADVYTHIIQNPERFKINSIDGYILDYKDLNLETIESIISFGYPIRSVKSFDDVLNYKATPIRGDFLSIYNEKLFYKDKNIYDSLNYVIKVTDGICGKGNSGAPVFFKLKNNEGYIFGGITSGADENTNRAIICRPEITLKSLGFASFEY
jgi:hypothetical protein